VIAAPENGVTEGVHADFGAELGDLHLANHRAIMCNEDPGDRNSFEGLGFGPLNLRKSATPSPQHWPVPDIPFMGVEARRDCGSDGPCPHRRQRTKRETL
jgi:hypothetical protein